MSFDRVPVIRITHGPSPAPTTMCSVPAGQWKIPRPEEPLDTLDEQPALPGQHEERLLLRLGVVEAGRDARLQDMEREAELRERVLLGLEVAPRTTRIQLQPYRVARVHDEPAVADRSETETDVDERSLGHRREPSAGLESPPDTATALGCARVRDDPAHRRSPLSFD
jgi:hypothetical protein